MNISIKQLIGEEYQQVQSFNDKSMASAPTTSLSVAREARKFEYELIADAY